MVAFRRLVSLFGVPMVAKAAVTIGDAEDSQSPIQRVVSLLEKMQAELTSEANAESEMYDKMVCWCETNEKQKTKAVADAEVRTGDLSAEINSRGARGAELATNIAATKQQIAADKAALLQARTIREKEAAEFSAEEKDMIQAVTNLKNAIAVLSRHNSGSSMLQMDDSPELFASVRAVLHDVSLKYQLMQADVDVARRRSRSSSRRVGAALLAVSHGAKDLGARLQGMLGNVDIVPVGVAEHELAKAVKQASMLQVDGRVGMRGAARKAPVDAAYESYSGRSAGIFGILNQMKDEFEANLSAEQKAELKAQEDFKALSASKSSQIQFAQEKLDSMEGDHADNQKALSDAKEDLGVTRDERAADVEFLRNLKLTCNDLDKQWQERSATRSEELKAVTEALGVLKEDDARDLMSKTVNFLQEGAAADDQVSMRQRRVRAVAALRKAARAPRGDFKADDLLAAWQGRAGGSAAPAVGAVGGPRAQLSTLAVSVQLDSFTEVTKIMDKMIADLKEQQAKEVESKDYCVKEFDVNEKATFTTNGEKSDLEAKLESLAAQISNLEEQIAADKAQIADTAVQVKQASETREKENAEFQSVVADQRATQTILKKALDRLAAFYKKEAALVQRAAAKQTPPVQFNTYKKNAGSSTVMGLLESITEDSKKLESEAVASESSAQAAYETMVKNSNQVSAQLEQAVVMKTKAVADARMESEIATADHGSTVGELESLADYKADLHMQCDFLLKNFDIRQRARLQEIEAVQGAKAILAGSAQA